MFQAIEINPNGPLSASRSEAAGLAHGGEQVCLHLSDAFQPFFAGVANVGAEPLAFGAVADFFLGFGTGGEADRAQRGGDVEPLAAMGDVEGATSEDTAAEDKKKMKKEDGK